MNIAQLLGELDAAVSQAKVAGDRVRKAIEELKSVFGSLGVESIQVVGPTIPLDENGTHYLCPYCAERIPAWQRIHRSWPKWGPTLRVVRHVAQMRRVGRKDHGAIKDPIPPIPVAP